MVTFEVQLAVYDLSRGMARSMSQAILGQRIDGIWHTGIVAYGKEYFFGGGIQIMPWGAFAASHGMQPNEVQTLGRTSKTQAELEGYLRTISHQFTQATYDLINHNCNNFSDTVSRFLLGTGIPTAIVDLPRIVFSTPGGAMLRPMIESMQNNVRGQQGYGLDPFSSTPQQALAGSMPSVVSGMAHAAAHPVAAPGPVPAAAPSRAVLEEKALVSADASSVPALSAKLLALPLSAEEQAQLRTITTALQGPQPKVFTVEDYALLEHILAYHPQAHMSCLFVLRLMFLKDRMTDFREISLIRAIMTRLLAKEGQEVASAGFATIPAHVMALAAMSNLLSHEAGLALLDTPAGTSSASAADISSELSSNLIDTVLSGLAHGRAEVRQMSSTLAYNLTLACTRDGQLSGPWASASVPAELNTQAMQLLCGTLEGILSESDGMVRQRRLATACRILRAFGQAAAELCKDLGLDDSLQLLRDGGAGPLSKEEAAVVGELLDHLR